MKEPNESHIKPTGDPQTKASTFVLDLSSGTPGGTFPTPAGHLCTWCPSTMSLPCLHAFALEFSMALFNQWTRRQILSLPAFWRGNGVPEGLSNVPDITQGAGGEAEGGPLLLTSEQWLPLKKWEFIRTMQIPAPHPPPGGSDSESLAGSQEQMSLLLVHGLHRGGVGCIKCSHPQRRSFLICPPSPSSLPSGISLHTLHDALQLSPLCCDGSNPKPSTHQL